MRASACPLNGSLARSSACSSCCSYSPETDAAIASDAATCATLRIFLHTCDVPTISCDTPRIPQGQTRHLI